MALIDHVPTVERNPWGTACLVLNLIPFVGGVGTIIAGAKTEDLKNILFGVLQMLIPFVGWIWAVLWGVLIYQRSTPS